MLPGTRNVELTVEVLGPLIEVPLWTCQSKAVNAGLRLRHLRRAPGAMLSHSGDVEAESPSIRFSSRPIGLPHPPTTRMPLAPRGRAAALQPGSPMRGD